jgi:hypothetical protein
VIKPDLEQLEVLRPKEGSNTVLEMEFSEGGTYLAISYDSKPVEKYHIEHERGHLQFKGSRRKFRYYLQPSRRNEQSIIY